MALDDKLDNHYDTSPSILTGSILLANELRHWAKLIEIVPDGIEVKI